MANTILLTQAQTQDELFNQVADQLESFGFVSHDYKKALKEREKDFPTGLKIDFRDGSDLYYAAIPHTETQYCLVDQLIYVQNASPLIFKHMINPEEDCPVKHFFFIVNNKNDGQTTILSNLINFFMTKGNIKELEKIGPNKESLKNYLIEKGVLKND
ncbi:PTS sugar transporter subunit IIA [Streptococcus catagoni]|uniref:PTS sugar transporter subunit IIA n=1 Tax=Streptococcus catagoni TaxID=2654874 RepID=UPI001407C142|nr:PTS sugar transporter subunit IIA [Streptococcus catagoni]